MYDWIWDTWDYSPPSYWCGQCWDGGCTKCNQDQSQGSYDGWD